MHIASSDVVDVSFLTNGLLQLIVKRRAWRHVTRRLEGSGVEIACLAPSDPRQLTDEEWALHPKEDLPALAAALFADRADEIADRVTDKRLAELLRERALRSRAHSARLRAQKVTDAVSESADSVEPPHTPDEEDEDDERCTPISPSRRPDASLSPSHPTPTPATPPASTTAPPDAAFPSHASPTSPLCLETPTTANKRARLSRPLVAAEDLAPNDNDVEMSQDVGSNVGGDDPAHRSL